METRGTIWECPLTCEVVVPGAEAGGRGGDWNRALVCGLIRRHNGLLSARETPVWMAGLKKH